MSHDLEGYFVISPKPTIYFFNENYLRDFRRESEYKAAFPGRKIKAAARVWPTFYCLGFSDGLQTEAAKPDGDRLVFSGPSLMRLVTMHGMKNKLDMFDALKVVAIYFEGNDRNNAQRYFEEVVTRIAGRTDKGGSKVNFSLDYEQAHRFDFWADILAGTSYSDNLTKPQ